MAEEINQSIVVCMLLKLTKLSFVLVKGVLYYQNTSILLDHIILYICCINISMILITRYLLYIYMFTYMYVRSNQI